MKATITAARPKTLWAVLNRTGQVIVIFGGTQATTEARRWSERGYRIVPLEDD